MCPKIEIYPYKALRMLLRQEVPECETVGIFLTVNAQGCEEWAYFDDVLILDVRDTENRRDPGIFSVEHGRQVLAFLEKNKTAQRICVCCDSGQSRSTAMAAAITRYFGADDMPIWENPKYHPNLSVYGCQLQAFGIERSETELQQLRAISDNALHEAIRRAAGR